MTDHIVKAYDAELDLIGAKIAEMGGIAEKMLSDAMDALANLDVALAQKVLGSDPRLDGLQREIEDQAVRTIARRQPMAVDLRELVASIHIAGDLERVGDLAKNIAKRAIKVADDARVPRAIVGLKHMAEVAALQLKNVLDAYAERDAERAKAVWSRDAELDALEDAVFRDLLTFMMEDPRNISFCAHLLFCGKNLERVGDHATNIAENVHFMVSGAPLPVNRPKG
jgi:phosphate transport system protein